MATRNTRKSASPSRVCLLSLATLLIFHLFCCWTQPALAGGKKGDTIVLGGGKGGHGGGYGHGGGGYGHGGGGGGCGPIILKTGKKGKGNTIIMSGCKKKTYHKPTYEYKTYHHFMPEYGGHGGYDHGSSGYGHMEHYGGGHEEHYGGYDDHGGYRK